MPPTPELHHRVATAKHELDQARAAGDELAAALAEDHLNRALDALSRRLGARERTGKVRARPNGETALRGLHR